MVREISGKVSNNRTYKVIMEMLGFGIGAYYGVDARGEFALIEMPCSSKKLEILFFDKKAQHPHSATSGSGGDRLRSAHSDVPRRKRAVDCLYSAQLSPIAALSSV